MDEMRLGICPKCREKDIYLNVKGHRGAAKVQLSWFSSIEIAQYICGACGFIEEYVKTPKARDKVRKKCVPVNEK
jgi:C4-type Zn-finger protein